MMGGGYGGSQQGGDVRATSTDTYQVGLSKLWGEKTLNQLRRYVEGGDIKKPSIRAMAMEMDVSGVYQENLHEDGLVETFERMLEDWFKKELFKRTSTEAKEMLLGVINKSRIAPIYEDGIKVIKMLLIGRTISDIFV